MNNIKKIFFIGISGIGMSGLAKIMAQRGYKVYGSDLQRKNITNELEKIGIKIFIGHEEKNVQDMDLVVRSSAIKKSNPEYKYALEKKIRVIKRGELLAEIMNPEKGIAVAGTHGKTTTSSMMASVLLKTDPTVVIGGILPEISSNSKNGTSGYFIAEADESDNSFLYLYPEYSIITNIEEDHMENHGSYENIQNSFKRFIEQTSGKVIVSKDCENISELIRNYENILTYSTKDMEADIYADNIEVINEETHYDVFVNNNKIDRFSLSIPGLHNVSNSLGVIYIALELGVAVEEIKDKLSKTQGADRRFDLIYNKEIKIVDDYAHHPTEIKATLKAAKERNIKKLVAIFQPHRYSRTKFLFEEFNGAFDSADEVILLPTYAAGETNIYNITEKDLAKKIAHKNKVKVLDTNESVLEEIKNAEINSMYLFMGAGDISQLAHEISKNLEEKC